MIPTTVLVTIMLATPADCLEYLDIRATTRPAMAIRSDITPSLVVINALGAKVALQCRGKEYRAVLLAY